MAWPLTPLVSFLANSVPVIGAAFLNALQTAINAVFTGALTLKKLQLDGTGGAATTVADGCLYASGWLRTLALLTDNALPGTVTIAQGQIGVGNTTFGYAVLDGAGAVQRHLNAHAVSRLAAGHYRIDFKDTLIFADYACVQATPWDPAGPRVVQYTSQTVGGKLRVEVRTFDLAGVAADCPLSVEVKGE